MSIQAIYRKTAKGLEEMNTRAYGLPSRERSVLIMFDGNRTAAEIIEHARHLGDAQVFFERLLGEGFIEPVSPAVETGEDALQQAKRHAARILLDTLGPEADTILVKLEACETPAEFEVQARRLRDVIKSIAGEARAKRFWEGLEPALPRG